MVFQGTEFLIVLGSGVFCLGVLVVSWILLTGRRGHGTPNWPRAAGEILNAKVVPFERETSDGIERTFTPLITYRYRVGDHTYTSKRLNFISDDTPTKRDRAAATSVVIRYPTGAAVKVFYNPANPKQAALEVPRPAAHRAVLLYGLTDVVMGLAILVLGIVLLP